MEVACIGGKGRLAASRSRYGIIMVAIIGRESLAWRAPGDPVAADIRSRYRRRRCQRAAKSRPLRHAPSLPPSRFALHMPRRLPCGHPPHVIYVANTRAHMSHCRSDACVRAIVRTSVPTLTYMSCTRPSGSYIRFMHRDDDDGDGLVGWLVLIVIRVRAGPRLIVLESLFGRKSYKLSDMSNYNICAHIVCIPGELR